MKTLTIDEKYMKLPPFIKERQIQDYVEQAQRWATRYPGRKVVYVFDGLTKDGIPPDMVKALERVGVDVRGGDASFADLAKSPSGK